MHLNIIDVSIILCYLAAHITGVVPDIYLFPFALFFSFAGWIAGTYLKPPENREQVKTFYRETRPWGFGVP